jgi:hypothetical protein
MMDKPEGKRPLGRPRHRWEENIKVELQEVGCWGPDWIELTQDRDRWRALVNAVMILRAGENTGNFLIGCFSKRTLLHEVKVSNNEDGIYRLIRNGSTYLPYYGVTSQKPQSQI